MTDSACSLFDLHAPDCASHFIVDNGDSACSLFDLHAPDCASHSVVHSHVCCW